ncbi:hypothetical protein [Chamaesiphon sp. VAR_69_metabat_338]|uniref:hypothetical protein n=1 Tax=Chamaesiphon sp. VAR_69_metabat_338 TaxID=2964704 RepID=UPI00286DBC2E|nr:hypothetical protein [Chamaesiphon sp. VAR_69_metabat_338]
MNQEFKKRLIGGLLIFGIMGSIYGFMTKPEGPATSMLKLILSLGGGGSLIAAAVMQNQINKSNPPSGK